MGTATGMFALATFVSPRTWNTPGKGAPSAMPATMHRATHTVR